MREEERCSHDWWWSPVRLGLQPGDWVRLHIRCRPARAGTVILGRRSSSLSSPGSGQISKPRSSRRPQRHVSLSGTTPSLRLSSHSFRFERPPYICLPADVRDKLVRGLSSRPAPQALVIRLVVRRWKLPGPLVMPSKLTDFSGHMDHSTGAHGYCAAHAIRAFRQD
jgi:hypothetical protein